MDADTNPDAGTGREMREMQAMHHHTAIPLRVCKALSVQKSQGMTVGEGEMFKKVIMYLLEEQQRKTPGIELTAVSRVKKGTDLAFGNDSSKIT